MIVDKINAYLNDTTDIKTSVFHEVALLAQANFNRQFGIKEDFQRSLRLSSIGQCLRKQAYNLLGFEVNGKAIDPRAKMVFFQGDMVELAIVMLAKVAGCKITFCGLEQQTVEIDGVTGHPDGVLETELGDYLVEVKSMSSYSFADFEDGQIDESYIYQMNAYLMALGLDKCVYIALNKDSGVMAERVMTGNLDIQAKIVENIKTLKLATKENLPEAKYKTNDKGIYPWQCSYCAYWKTCHPKAEMKLVGKSNKLVEAL